MKHSSYIQKVVGREILDSRGNPTVEVDVFLPLTEMLTLAILVLIIAIYSHPFTRYKSPSFPMESSGSEELL